MSKKHIFLSLFLALALPISVSGCFSSKPEETSVSSVSKSSNSSTKNNNSKNSSKDSQTTQSSSLGQSSSSSVYSSIYSSSSSEYSSEYSSIYSSSSYSIDSSSNVVLDDLQIHFLQLGNANPGDCTLIKVGDTEVLIDAGSKKNSARTTIPYIKKHCTDGVLEYVIATHAHEDHIAAFVGDSTQKGVFESFECSMIIDWAKTKSTTQIYNSYLTLREAEVKAGATHYTALECYEQKNGAQKSYDLGSGVTLNILYQKYYKESTTNENDNSVCVLISQENNHFLFTGDLESSGEESLVASNKLPKCKVFKAGHHGSATSSSAKLLAVIQPEIVVIPCVAGTTGTQYYFPKQETIDTISLYTDKVYVPLMATSSSSYSQLNGNIVVTSNLKGVSVNCSNNNTLFKDTDWFKTNRTLPSKWKN